jgi:hypothetical protein
MSAGGHNLWVFLSGGMRLFVSIVDQQKFDQQKAAALHV